MITMCNIKIVILGNLKSVATSASFEVSECGDTAEGTQAAFDRA